MSKVKILPPEIASKIAAGEVIERPASVIKELLENALDADSTAIEIIIQKAGKTGIIIKDNGSGIDRNDMETIFLRHSTSKISSLDDLFAIRSLGFRGEALYSIAAISDIIVRSQTADAECGMEIHVRGGEKLSLKPTGMNQGTEIEIKELFFNTPARKKFLRSDTVELQHIMSVIIPYALLYPEKRFTVIHNKKTLLDLAPDENPLDRIGRALNINPDHCLTAARSFTEERVAARLILGDINIQRPRKTLQFIFVNNRPVSNHLISFHLNHIYKLILPPDRSGCFLAFIDLPVEDIDVNIHPTKREVRIKSEFNFVSLLRHMAEETLMQGGKAKEIDPATNWQPPISTVPRGGSSSRTGMRPSTPSGPEHEVKYSADEYLQKTFAYQGELSTPAEAASVTEPQGSLKNKLAATHYVGAFLRKYLFFESGTSLLVVDQHAAHERITYEKILRQITAGTLERQQLLTPITLALSPQEKIAWDALQDHIEQLGFSTALWDNDTLAISAYPAVIKHPETAIRAILSDPDAVTFDHDMVARRACRGSIMAGEMISSQEALALRHSLVRCDDPFTCPHGRPTVIELAETTLEKYFLRK